jgi:hypothetical protein
MRHRWVAGLAALGALPLAHAGIAWGTRMSPPRVELPRPEALRSWTRTEAGVREMYLEGTPEAIGASHARLGRPNMVAVEQQLWGDFERYVPLWIARLGIEDWSRLRYRHVDRGIPEDRRRELAAQAAVFDPDPFAARLPTYQRIVFLHALYDISLSLEHSPLIGCTSFAVDPGHTRDGHPLVGRAFDFEAGDVFDRDKIVFLVREHGAIPFASVAWAGLVGVVTGMNADGVFLAVHGARAGEPSNVGIPVTLAVREALSHARDTQTAVAILRRQPVMVSHMVFVADSAGHFAVVERAPGSEAFVRTSVASIAVTNHFEGPLASDPKNERVRETTSTLARRRRIDHLLSALGPNAAGPLDALSMLRDHSCGDDGPCFWGDRRAIDALIATHGVVGDTRDRILWVSAGPHLSGPFVRLDLRALLAPMHDPSADLEPEILSADGSVPR